MWTRMRINPRRVRVADGDSEFKSTKMSLKDKLRGKSSKPGDVLDDGTPNPETETGRAKLIQKLELSGGDLRLRTQILDKALKQIADTPDRESFRNELYEIVANFIKLKNTDIVEFSKELINVVTKYEHARGRKIDPKVVDYLRVARVARVRTASKSR